MSNKHISRAKAKNNNEFHKLRKIRFNSWMTKCLLPGYIGIFDSELIHIENRHSEELKKIGMSSFDFVTFIANNFNEIRKGSEDCLLLIVRRDNYSNWAAIELTEIDKKKNYYKIKTASILRNSQLLKKKLLTANEH